VKKRNKRRLGMLMLGIVFGILFILTAADYGLQMAALAWSGALVVAVVVHIATGLIFEESE